MSVPQYNSTLHRLALATACATFPLIFMGGLVTSHQAGLAVPDWPNTYGYNMFLFPPNQWIGGIFYEHTHRLAGAVVGMLAIALTIAAWRLDSRPWVRWLAAGVLGAVSFQGLLGGLRVILVNLDLAIIHACLAQAFFCLAALMTIVTSRWWLSAERDPQSPVGRSLVVAAVAAVVIIYVQLIAGAVMRHYQAGLAIPDVPLAYGRMLPATTADELIAINNRRVFEMQLPKVTAGQIWIHFIHRVGALAVTLACLILIIKALLTRNTAITWLAAILAILIISQLTLGVFVVLWRKPADLASIHVAVGALTLVVTFILAVRAMRLYLPGLLDRPQRKLMEAGIKFGAMRGPMPA